jgi:hypothetical protein
MRDANRTGNKMAAQPWQHKITTWLPYRKQDGGVNRSRGNGKYDY